MGAVVLRATSVPGVTTFAHSALGNSGGVAAVAVNLRNDTIALQPEGCATREVYVLSPADGDLTSGN
eukprot:gene8729-3975_t